jgi:hypothetical protein
VILTAENYYSVEANAEFMSVSTFKDYFGTYGKPGCEAHALAKQKGEWQDETTTALLVGSFVDAFYEKTLDKYKAEHADLFTSKIIEIPETASKLPPEYITRNGTIKRDKLAEAKINCPDAFDIQYELKAPYKQAEIIIERTLKDRKFQEYMSGEKQVIMTAELFGTPWKIKIDSYHPGIAIVDLKVMESISKQKYVSDIGLVDFIRFWAYEIQGAIYQKVVEINTGKKLPFYLAAVTKSDHPRLEIIQIPQSWLDDGLSVVEANMPRIISIRNGIILPDRCELESCDYCCDTHVITKPISADDLLGGI